MYKFKPTAFIWDIDGVIADSIRDAFKLDFMQGDFSKFEAEIPTFDTFEWAIEITRLLSKSGKHKLIFITARNEGYKVATEAWLQAQLKLSKRDYELHMRPFADRRPDVQLKAEVLPKVLDKYEILAAFDDNLDNAKLYSYFGIKSLHVL